jgi:hypothetical protein
MALPARPGTSSWWLPPRPPPALVVAHVPSPKSSGGRVDRGGGDLARSIRPRSSEGWRLAVPSAVGSTRGLRRLRAVHVPGGIRMKGRNGLPRQLREAGATGNGS